MGLDTCSSISPHSVYEGDPDEVIGVPLVTTVDKANVFKQMFGKRKLEHQVHTRYMKRSHYQRHYAKDGDGNYVGTEKPAADAHLVYVASKSTPEDVKEQVRKCAKGKLHYIYDMGGCSGSTMHSTLGWA